MMIVLLLIIILFQAVCLIVLVGLAKRQLSLAKLAVQPSRTPAAASHTLSAREAEVLDNICRGLSNREIADRLSISKRTVDRHRANILEKTATTNTAELVVYALRNKLVDI